MAASMLVEQRNLSRIVGRRLCGASAGGSSLVTACALVFGGGSFPQRRSVGAALGYPYRAPNQALRYGADCSLREVSLRKG
jgi:hypothetical protein